MPRRTRRQRTATLWSKQGLTWKDLARRIYQDMNEDSLYGHCAELAYYFLFSVFPLLVFLTTLLGYMAGESAALRMELFGYLRRIAPSGEVFGLLINTLNEITQGRDGVKLYLSLVIALWVASTGMIAIGRTLNRACGLRETRPWWNRRLTALILTVIFSAFIISALALMLYGHALVGFIADRLAVDPFLETLWSFLQWPVVLVFLLVSFEMIYNYAPNLGKSPHRVWGTPGAVFGVALFVLATWGLRSYLAQFGAINMAYGSLGAVIVLLLWFYFIALAILMGGEVNSELARARGELRERQGLPAIEPKPPRRPRRLPRLTRPGRRREASG
ncbi:MAG TPA: YihY/virulence factor BrkB family protein [Thermoanaerobaculia bacterium]|nr:YihY/virulence factor BrkB family protein [Thermoanaerobaculia bacterium]